MANARVNLHPDNVFSTINIGFKSQRFAYENTYSENINNYNKFAPYINLDFKKRYAISLFQHRLTYRYVMINQKDVNQQALNYGVHDLVYQFSNNSALYPMLIKVKGQANSQMQKISITYTQKIFVNKTKYFEIRAFAGKMYQNPTYSSVGYNFRLSGYNGGRDYLYDNLYLGRNETQGLAANQFAETDGAFKVYTILGQSANWLATLNIKSPKILKLPILLYADIGTCAPDGLVVADQKLFYNAGIDVVIMRDIFEIFIPLLITQNIKDNNALNNNFDFLHQIRFTLNVNKINPFAVAKQVISY